MPSYAPLTPGDPQRLGDLAILGKLGEGGQGVVYLARNPSGAQVAVKWLQPDQTDDHVSVGRFLREAEVARRVAPFCTAAVLGTGVEGGRPYIVSEFVEGSSLQQVVQDEGPRRGSGLDRLAIGTATALAAIHQAGIVHRDFKPANVILGADGPRVIDFGIARALNATSTFSNSPVGTPAYMSPEQFMGDTIGPASDMFSWAGTMIYASSGWAPFGSGAMHPLINRVLSGQPDLGTLDGPLRDVVAECLSKDPARRPTAQQVIMRLLGHPVPQQPVADVGLLERGAREASAVSRPQTDRRPDMDRHPSLEYHPSVERRPEAERTKAKGRIVVGVATAVVALIVVIGVAVAVVLQKISIAAGPTTASASTTASPKETSQAPQSPTPATPTKSTLPGGQITLHEQSSDPIALTAYEVYNKNLDDDIDYARRSLRGSFDKHPGNWESLVSPDGRYLAGRPQDYTSDDYDSILFTDRKAGSSFRVKTVRKPLISTLRAWSKDGSKVLLNIDKKIKDNKGEDDWISTGFAVVDVAQAKASVVEVPDTSIQDSDFGWDATGTGVVIVYGKDEGLRFFDASGKHTRDIAGIGPLASGTLDIFSPSGKMFVTNCRGGGDGDHCIWDTGTGKRARTFSSDCDKVLGWYDESHLYCWEQDNAANDEVRVVAFDGKLMRTLLEVPDTLDFTPYFTVNPTRGS
ncbi:protein kinase [Nonomuraea sp. NPDC049480]|uniref:protein kinase domain-containing protein n=1 Tax=Nonomuraea sp. NPDC049480 TaxID=3364353 RepID=UPI0037939911